MGRALEQAPLELDGYDDGLARLLIDTVRVVDGEQVVVCFKDGSESKMNL